MGTISVAKSEIWGGWEDTVLLSAPLEFVTGLSSVWHSWALAWSRLSGTTRAQPAIPSE